MNTTVDTYADGSIAVGSVSIPEGEPGYRDSDEGISTRSVRACSRNSSNYAAYWKNCVADVNLGIIRMQFNFNYEFVKGSASKITRY